MIGYYIRHYGKIFILEFGCIIAWIIYIFNLSSFNNILVGLQAQGMSDLALLSYDDGLAWKYFFGAAILFLVVIGTILHRLYYVRAMKHRHDKQIEIFWSIISIICMILLLWGLFAFIRIPILRAILKVLGVSSLIVSFLTDNDSNRT